MQQEKLRKLIEKYAKGTCTAQERKWLEGQVLRKPLLGDWTWNSEEEKILMGIRIRKGIDAQRFGKRKPIIKRMWYAGLAASILLILGGTWLWQYQKDSQAEPGRLVINESVSTSADAVMLTLSDGTQVNLDQQGDGMIGKSGAVSIKKTADGQLVYEHGTIAQPATGKEIAQNTIATPNGKQFQMSLPDGTKVWLNTASKLSYPVAFNGTERNVSLEGEAYFEVAHDAAKPFKIKAQDTQIEVTGTEFNVSAYLSDRKVITTLLKGGVNVRKKGQEVSLSPGYQAVSYAEGATIDKLIGNAEQTMAWKNGYFIFDNMDIVSIMRSVARWYDIRVTVEGKIPTKKFGGTFPMTANVDELLLDLSTLGHVKLEKKGKEVRVIW